jgi:hypothetical protein
MALVGHISGSIQSNSVIGISGSVIIANEPDATFPSLPGSDVKVYINDLVALGSSGLASSGSLIIKGADGSAKFSATNAGNLTLDGSLNVVGESTLSSLSVTGNETVGGNLTVTGDLTVNGSMVTVNTTNLEVKDAVVGLGFASGTVGQASGDRGLILGLGSGPHSAFLWKNSESEFAVGTTTSSATGSLPVTLSSYSNFHANNIQGSIISASLGFSGSLTKLVDGTSYLIASSPITITTGSNGSVTIGSTATTLQGGNGSNNNIITADGVGGLVAEGNLNFDGAHLGISGTFGSTALTVASGVLYHSNGMVKQDADFVWDSLNGRLGIGTAAPATLLHIGPPSGTSFRLGPTGSFIECGQANVATYRWKAGGAVTAIEQNVNHIYQNLTTVGFQSQNGQPSDITLGRAAAGILRISGSAPGAVLRFNATSTPLAAGDLAMNTTSGRPTAFIEGSPRTLSHTDEVALLTGATFTGVTNHNAGLTSAGHILPSADVTFNLGSATNRWANIFTGDLHLKNERGDWTLIEEEAFLSIRNNKTGKRFKINMEPIPELDEELGEFSTGPKL